LFIHICCPVKSQESFVIQYCEESGVSNKSGEGGPSKRAYKEYNVVAITTHDLKRKKEVT
jgi:hypothetical protein